MRTPSKKFFENARQMFLVRLNMGAFNGIYDAKLMQDAYQCWYLSILEPEAYAAYFISQLKQFDPENIKSFYLMYFMLQQIIAPSTHPQLIIMTYDREVYGVVTRLSVKSNTRNSR